MMFESWSGGAAGFACLFVPMRFWSNVGPLMLLIGLALLASLRDYRRKGMLMFVIAGAFGLGLMAFSVSSNMLFFLAVLALVNACAMAVDTLYKTLMQENVAEEERGRAMGSWVLSIGTAPVGHLGVGGLAGLLGAPGALLVTVPVDHPELVDERDKDARLFVLRSQGDYEQLFGRLSIQQSRHTSDSLGRKGRDWRTFWFKKPR